MEEQKVAKLRAFVAKQDLGLAEQKIKEQLLKLDEAASKARSEVEKLSKALNDKQLEALALAQQLEGVCKVVLELDVDNSTPQA